MAELTRGSFSRGGGVGTPTGTVGNTAYAQVSPLASEPFADLYAQARSAIPTELASLQSMITGGMNSPLLRAVLDPALARLQAPQAQQREQLTEATRAAGGLRGSQYSGAYNQLLQNQGQQQNDLMGQVIQQVLATLVQGQLQEQRNQFLPAESLMNLLKTISPATVTGSMGGGGGGSVIGGRSGGSFLDSPYVLDDPGMQDWLRRVGYTPTSGGGFAGTGVNSGGVAAPAPAPAPYTPYLDPLSGGGAAPPLLYNYGGGWTTNNGTPETPWWMGGTGELPQDQPQYNEGAWW